MTEKSNVKKTEELPPDFFKKVFNSFADAVFVHDLKGDFLEVNKIACQKLGYKKEELLKMSPMEIDAPEYAGEFKEKIKELKQKGSAIMETVHVTKKGNRIPIELSSKVIDFKGKKAILSIARDISERLNERKKAEKNAEKFKELFDHVKSGVIIYEAKNKGKYFTVKDLNRAAEKIEGKDKKNILGKSALKVFPNIKKEGTYEAIKRVYKTNRSQAFPLVSEKNGEIKSWRENYFFKLSTGEVVNVYEDVTEQRKEKEELKRTKDKMERIVEFVPSAIFTVDRNRRILSWNKNAEEVTGYSKDEIIGKKCTKFSLYPCREVCGLWGKDTKKPIFGKECTIKTKSGEKRTVSKNVDFLYNSRGEKVGGIESFVDITREKKRENKIKEKMEELEKINKLLTGRELKMIELKEEIKELKQKIAENSDKIEI